MPDDELFAFRSMTSIVYCHAPAREQPHGIVEHGAHYDEVVAAFDAANPACAPHHIQPLTYPMPGAGLAIDTEHSAWAVCVYLDSPQEYLELTEAGKPIPWVLILPSGEQYVTTDSPGMVAAMLSQFAGLRIAEASLTSVDEAYEQLNRTREMLAVLDGHAILDPADQHL